MGTHHPIRKTVAPAPVAIPDKLYFRIGDVARLCGVAAYVLRFWETEFPQLKPNKGGTGQRLYRRKDVEMALRIKSLLYAQGYTIPGARLALKSDLDSAPAEPTLSIGERSAETAPAEGLHLAPSSNPVTTRNLRALHALRDELHSLATLLALPVSTGISPVPARPKPLRPRLVEVKPEPKLQIAQPKLQQGDLFGVE